MLGCSTQADDSSSCCSGNRRASTRQNLLQSAACHFLPIQQDSSAASSCSVEQGLVQGASGWRIEPQEERLSPLGILPPPLPGVGSFCILGVFWSWLPLPLPPPNFDQTDRSFRLPSALSHPLSLCCAGSGSMDGALATTSADCISPLRIGMLSNPAVNGRGHRHTEN